MQTSNLKISKMEIVGDEDFTNHHQIVRVVEQFRRSFAYLDSGQYFRHKINQNLTEMGKNYYCDYCEKRLKNDAQVIKKHISGLAHTAARNEHYAKYKDSQTILTEESQKTPCQRYFRGECKFGGNCRFSHYTPEELSNFQDEVNSSAYMKWYQEQPKPVDEIRLASFLSKPEKCDSEIRQLSQIWSYPNDLVAGVYYLPQSLHKLDPECVPKKLSEWG